MTLALRGHLRLRVLLNHSARHAHGVETDLHLDKRAGESTAHVVMKFLSWCVRWHPDLVIEASVGQRYKPDLVRVDARGRPIEWIDCGHTGIPKLRRIVDRNRQTRFVIVKATPGELQRYRYDAEPRLSDPERVGWLSFGGDLVSELAEVLQTRHHVVATVAEQKLYLEVDGASWDANWVGSGLSAT